MEARSWGTQFRFYQETFGDDVMDPKNAEFLVNAYMREAFILAPKDCWSLRNVKLLKDLRVLCPQEQACPVVVGVQGRTTVIIQDDGDSGTLSFWPENRYNFSEPSTDSPVTITITRTGGSSKAVTFAYEIVSTLGTASVAVDVKAVGKPVVAFNDGETLKTFPITLLHDDNYENPDEYFVVRVKF